MLLLLLLLTIILTSSSRVSEVLFSLVAYRKLTRSAQWLCLCESEKGSGPAHLVCHIRFMGTLAGPNSDDSLANQFNKNYSAQVHDVIRNSNRLQSEPYN